MAEQWQPCPRCGSKRVVVGSTKGAMIGGGVLALVLGLAFFVLFWPLGALLGAAGLVLLVSGPFAGTTLRCRDCNHSWAYGAKKGQAG